MNSEKKQLHHGDIILVDFRDIGGSVQRGLRPAVVVSNEKALKYGTVANVLPITSKLKNIPVHVPVDEGILPCKSQILPEQISSIDINVHYVEHLGRLSDETLCRVHDALLMQLNLKI